jgi:hypothetical protein
MSHHDPIDGSDRRNDLELLGPLEVPPMEVRHIGAGAEEVTARLNALNGAATLAWCLFLIALAGGIPAVVLLWRAAF